MRRKQSPLPRLGHTHFEPDGHREQTAKLSEDHLLSGFSSNGLKKQGSGRAGVQMAQEPIDTALAVSGESLAEINELSYRLERVVVCALGWSSCTEHVRDHCGMSDLLVCHKLD